MNSYQRGNWKRIRKSKVLFFIKYISLFSIPVLILILMLFCIRGFNQLYNEIVQLPFLDLGLFVFMFLVWFYLGYIHGNSSWKTWEKEYSGEKAFVTKISDITKQASGATHSPYKEIFALVSSLVFIFSPILLLIHYLRKIFEIPSVRFDISDYRAALSFVLVVFATFMVIITIFMVGGFIGLVLWIVLLRPFYTYEEVINYISLSNRNNLIFLKTFNRLLFKVANFIYKRNKK